MTKYNAVVIRVQKSLSGCLVMTYVKYNISKMSPDMLCIDVGSGNSPWRSESARAFLDTRENKYTFDDQVA